MKTVQITFQHKADSEFKMISNPFQITVEMKDYQDQTLQKIACHGILQKLYPNDSLQIISIN
jgi:hypothetical protein